MKNLTHNKKGFLFLILGAILIILGLPLSLSLGDISDTFERHTFANHFTSILSFFLTVISVLGGIIGFIVGIFIIVFKIDLFD